MKSVVRGPWSVVRGAPGNPCRLGLGPRPRRGITLTEILISIMILGVGLISLATLFPIGLVRLRDAARWSRSATLLQTAAADAVARGLLDSRSFVQADNYNVLVPPSQTPSYWYVTASGQYNPVLQDTPYYLGDWLLGAYAGVGGLGTYPNTQPHRNPGSITMPGPGIMFAYDPLWRYQVYSTANPATQGYYIGDTYEARFGYGLTTVGNGTASTDYDGNGVPSAHGLPRLTNFNRVGVMPSAIYVPNIFVSQEDLVWQDPHVESYTVNGISRQNSGVSVQGPSPLVPDLSPSADLGQGANGGSISLDWHFSWMFTGQLSNAGNASTFDGNIVIFENRPFGIQAPANAPYAPAGNFAGQNYQVDGETVVEGIFGYSGNIVQPGANGQPTNGTPGYGAGADRTVLLRWSNKMADPVVRPGDWIADVTYERQMSVVFSRFYNGGNGGYPNAANKLEWDNLPAQRCFWYQVQKVSTPGPDVTYQQNGLRSMVVFVNQNLQARTVLNGPGTPAFMNAALIAPNVVNVIPQTIFVRANSPNSVGP